MSGLAVRNKSGELLQYTGTQFEGLENTGTHHLCVRTGAGAGDVKKYGLTSAPLNDKYKALKMRIPDNAGGNGGRDAYIAQRYSTSASASSARTYTASRVSNYVSSTTLRTASSTRLSTGNATRVSTHAPIYYGKNPITITNTTSQGYKNNAMTQSATGMFVVTGVFVTGVFANDISAATYKTSATINGTRVVLGTKSSGANKWYYTYQFKEQAWAGDAYQVTRTQTSRASNYISSKTLSTASSSRLSTGNATRSSQYNTSSSASTTSSKLTHNVNL